MNTLIDIRRSPAFDSHPAGFFGPTSLPQLERGRGACSNPTHRYAEHDLSYFDDGWESLAELPALKTEVFTETPKTIITRNDSPDISFDRSINPYRGCEHGCVYCYARPAHAYMGLSPGLDFESKLFIKPNAAALLREELTAPNYQPRTIALGANTDPYQPIERSYRITRSVIEVLAEFRHPFGIVTKSGLVARDIDLLGPLGEQKLVKVALSVTTLDAKLARAMEPRAATPSKRLRTIEGLARAGVPTVVMIGPIIPGLNDHEVENILKAAAAAGAKEAGYTMLRLPHEVRGIFRDWLEKHYPDRLSRVMSLSKDAQGGRETSLAFGERLTGSGPLAWTIGRRFQLACQRNGLNLSKVKLDHTQFRRPVQAGEQLALF